MQYNFQTNSILNDKTRKQINVKKSKKNTYRKNTCQYYKNTFQDHDSEKIFNTFLSHLRIKKNKNKSKQKCLRSKLGKQNIKS